MDTFQNTKKKGALLYFALSIGSGVVNLAFQVLMNRQLGPTVYGGFVALMSLVSAFIMVASAIQSNITLNTMSNRQNSNFSNRVVTPTSGIKYSMIVSMFTFGLIYLFSAKISGYLNLSSRTPVVYLGVYISLTIISIIPQGRYLGQLAFARVGFSLFINSIVRFICGVVFSVLNYKLEASILAVVCGMFAQVSILLFHGRKKNIYKSSKISWNSFKQKNKVLSMFSLVGIAALFSFDSIVTKHLFSNYNSSIYAQNLTTARLIFFFLSPIPSIAFPYFVLYMKNKEVRSKYFNNIFMITLILGTICSGILVLFQNEIVTLLFGNKYPINHQLLETLVAYNLMLILCILMTYYFIAVQSKIALLPWLMISISFLSVFLFHKTCQDVAGTLVIISVVTLSIQLLRIKTIDDFGANNT